MNPYKIAFAAGGSYFLLVVMQYVFQKFDVLDPNPMRIWLLATSMLLFYVFLSSIYCFKAKDRLLYYRQSTIAFVLIGIVLVATAQLFSGIQLSNAQSHQWIIIVISLVYLVFMTIIALIRKIVDIAIKQDNSINHEN